jgi:small basic protein
MSASQNSDRRRLARWFVRGLILAFRAELSIIVVLSILLAGLQGSALLVINWAIGAAEAAPYDVPYLGWTLGTGQVIYAAIVASISALTAAATLEYAKDARILQLWKAYQLRSIRISLDAVRTSRRSPLLKANARRVAARLLGRSHRMGALSRVFCSLFAPCFRLLMFSGAALLIHWKAALAFFCLVLPIGLVLALSFGRQTAVWARAVEETTPDAVSDLEDRLALAIAAEKASHDAQGDASSPLDIRVDALLGRLRAVIRSKFLATIFFAALTLGIVIAMAQRSLGDMTSGALLLFLAAIALSLVQISQIVNLLATLGRFFPSMVEHYMVLAALNDELGEAASRKWLSGERFPSEPTELFD